MSYYRKFISYIDLYEYGERVKNVGFVKSEIKDNIWKVKVNIRGLEETDTVMCEMKTAGAEEYLDRFQIVKGQGQFEKEYEIEHLAGTEISFANVHGLIFQISSHKFGKCTWAQDNCTYHVAKEKQAHIEAMEQKYFRDPKLRSEEKQRNEEKQHNEEKQRNEEKQHNEERQRNEEKQHNEERQRNEEKQHNEERQRNEEKQHNEEKQVVEKREWPDENNKSKLQKASALPEYQSNNISGNKWMQLGRMYPAIHPFHEKYKGEYISVKPKDFVILHEKYQALVNNSFLLHGYFNYRHIILGKKEEEQKVRYYIGVPGTFHEREKMVAVMFGFEEFEGVDSEERGAFGYYMKEVKI